MAELLLMNRSDLPPDSDMQQGDVIVIAPDGYVWGSGERDPATFLIVKVPGVSISQIGARLGIPAEELRDDVPIGCDVWEEPTGTFNEHGQEIVDYKGYRRHKIDTAAMRFTGNETTLKNWPTLRNTVVDKPARIIPPRSVS